MVEGVESGETKLTLVAITNNNAFLPATKEIIITITPDSLLVVDVMDPDDRFILAEGSSRTISVRPELIDVATTVEVTVNVEEGSGLRVMPSSLMFFNSTVSQSLTVEALTDPIYRGDRRVEFSLTAVDYIEHTVTVDIIEDQLRPIGLDVGPTNLSLSSRTPSTLIAISINNVVTDDVLRVAAEGDVVGFNSFNDQGPHPL